MTEIIAELTRHTFIENGVMYPEVRKLLPDLEDDVLESYEEHHVEEEEADWFPKVREGLSRSQLSEIGVRLLELNKPVPTDPSDPKAKKSAHDAITA